jgi:general stress protein 26
MTQNTDAKTIWALDRSLVTRVINKQSFATLATVSSANRPHVAGVIYSPIDMTLYVATERDSRKARNIADNPNVAVCIPARRVPIGPPSTLQFQATAEILPLDDSEMRKLHEAGRLKTITSHGELDDPANCFVRITPGNRINGYGLGMSLWRLARDPLNCAGRLDLQS